MNLKYSILWFDDDKDFVDSIDLSEIREVMQSSGFSLEVVPVYSSTEFNSHHPFNSFDLIVVDFNLGDENGGSFIEAVRNNSVFTEVIFYSVSNTGLLWKAIHDKKLEGVFVTHKSVIAEKLVRIFNQSVRKVLDIENMRGIVMSEVGDLDALLESIFTKAMDGLSHENKNYIFNSFHERSDKQIRKRLEALSDFKSAPSISTLIELCDSGKRWHSFNSVKKRHPALKNANVPEDYPETILWPRNCLAHGTPCEKENGVFEFLHQGKQYVFDENSSRELRLKILEFKAAFTEVDDLLDKE